MAARPDPTLRFSDRVVHYMRYRPGYPPEVLKTLEREAGLLPAQAIADIGSGTGISARLFLEAGHTVYAVEPNGPMREQAEAWLHEFPGFHSVVGTAEQTNLSAASVDLAVAAQAFHWFDAEAARREWDRILRPGGRRVLMWNSRRVDSTPFLRAYEALLLEFATDYEQVDHRHIDPQKIRGFLGPGFQYRSFPTVQDFDLAGLEGRLLSSSYTPPPGDARYEPMLERARRIFAEHAESGRVRMEYDTELYWSL